MAGGVNGISRFMRRALIVLGLAVAFASLQSLNQPASAQEVVRRVGILDRLFGGPPRREILRPPPQQRRILRPRRGQPVVREQRSRRRGPAAAAVPAEPEKPAVEKLENARTVLVVGDFLAGGLAEGLEAAYAESPGVRVVDRSNGSSGFVRDDFYNWGSEIGPILEDVKPAAVVVMIGSNDRQSLTVNGQAERPQTDAWRKEYLRRVDAFAEAIKAKGVPLIWTGVPPFKSSSMSSDMLAFNDIYKQAAEAADGSFVDIWEGFVDENGAFTFTGPDMNGQPVRLRSSDGINFTRAAKRKVAFYVEKPLAKILGAAVAPEATEQGIEALPQPGVALGTPADLTRTQPVSLAGPDLDGGSELLGAPSAPSPPSKKKQEPSAQPGRADDFLLRKRLASDRSDPTSAISP